MMITSVRAQFSVRADLPHGSAASVRVDLSLGSAASLVEESDRIEYQAL